MSAPVTAEDLNKGCACRSLDEDRLRRELETDATLGALLASRPHLFSAMAVFVSQQQLEAMASVVNAAEQLVRLPSYQEAALRDAPPAARRDWGPRGAFNAFDFHVTTQGPRLIEINTNAGGALLNAALARAQRACCTEWTALMLNPASPPARLEDVFLDMFMNEWRLQRGAAPLARVAIVDDDPAGQYLHPEFLLFQRMFERAGIEAVIADGRELEWRDGRLQHGGQAVDLVYNRLTDFSLREHAALQSAYQAGDVVLTPSPRHHALYADKRNLVLMSDAGALETLGLPAATRAVLLAATPRTERVTPERADDFWERRRSLFFKPVAGYGGRAAYRGDKLTRRVWQDILCGDYVAQALVPPSERRTTVDGAESDLKLDVRAYAYDGRIQLLAARLYQGQTTNFRTAGGGFAPVFLVPRDGSGDGCAVAHCSASPGEST